MMFNDKRRGDIWWAQDTTHKREDTTYDQVLLTGYGAPSMALTRQVHAMDTDDLTEYRGRLTDADMLRLDAVLRRALGV